MNNDNTWQELGCGLEILLTKDCWVFIRNPLLGKTPQIKLKLGVQNNVIDFQVEDGLSAGGVEARFLIVQLVKDKLYQLKSRAILNV
jgi:hypothetical protein